jgi:hypothetical protein
MVINHTRYGPYSACSTTQRMQLLPGWHHEYMLDGVPCMTSQRLARRNRLASRHTGVQKHLLRVMQHAMLKALD